MAVNMAGFAIRLNRVHKRNYVRACTQGNEKIRVINLDTCSILKKSNKYESENAFFYSYIRSMYKKISLFGTL